MKVCPTTLNTPYKEKVHIINVLTRNSLVQWLWSCAPNQMIMSSIPHLGLAVGAVLIVFINFMLLMIAFSYIMHDICVWTGMLRTGGRPYLYG